MKNIKQMPNKWAAKGAITLAAAAAVLALTSTAHSADLPRREAAPAPVVAALPIFTWEGFYVGANVGWGSRNDSFGYSVTPATSFPSLGKKTSNGIVGGVQAGYNWQYGAMVLGIEADIQATGLSSTRSRTLAGGRRARGKSEVDWYGTVRPRVGYAWNQTLLYITGGLAYGNVKFRLNGRDGAANVFALRSNKTRVGWTVGGGIEQAFSRSWSAKLEYGYVDLGRNSSSASVFTAGGVATGATARARPRARFHTVRAGLNYRF